MEEYEQKSNISEVKKAYREIMSKGIVRKYVVIPQDGLHARPAGEFAKLAIKYAPVSDDFEDNSIPIKVWKEGNGQNPIDGRSIMGLLTLATERGQELIVEAPPEFHEKLEERLRGILAKG